MTPATCDDGTTKLPFEREVNVIGKYILTHPFWQRAFPEFKPSDVVNVLLRHMKNNTIRVAFGPDGEITGLLLFNDLSDEGLIEVCHLLGHGQGIVMAAIEAWRTTYPECQVSVRRRGKTRIYEPAQFFEALKKS